MNTTEMKAPSIMLSGVANAVERTDLNRTAMPSPTKSYQPVQHGALVDMIEDSMGQHGYKFGLQEHALWRDGDARYFGMMQLLHSTDNADDQFALMLGIRNSYDMSISAQMLLGANVFLCANMSYSAADIVGRKHTTNIMRDLPALIDAQVAKTAIYAEIQETRFARYQEHTLTDTRADRLMINMIRSNSLQTSRLEKVIKEWYEPKFDHGGKRVWRLFNACTEALKGTPIHDMPRRTLGLQALMDNEARFEAATPVLAVA
jgi:hypothetical protein